MKTIEQLQEENAALAAQVEAFKKIREDWKGLAVNDAKTLIAFIEAADKTPQQHLAEIRAEAIESAIKATPTHKMTVDNRLYHSQSALLRYAEQIRKGEVN